jgi:23S rRNA (pseudouridine1915-N3)-methyltransferase
MKLRLVWVDKTRDPQIAELLQHYLQRLNKYVKYEIHEIGPARAAQSTIALANEAKQIQKVLATTTYRIVLDETGKQWTSQALADFLAQQQLRGTGELAFIIGSHQGLAAELKQTADLQLALSRLTLTHEMARLLLAEQLYRAYTIISGHPYQR